MAPVRDDDPHVPLDPDIELGSGGDDAEPLARHRQSPAVQTSIVLALACGGALGAICRYALSRALPTQTGRFPWGTFLINVSGSAVLGFILIVLIERFPRGRLARPVIGTGFIGAYTTFSTFMVEAILLVRDGHPVVAIAYVAASLIAGLVAVWIGMTGARLAVKAERWRSLSKP